MNACAYPLDVLPRDKQLAYDLQRSLIHECGHLIVGDHVGVINSFADFWLYEDVDPVKERLVGGQCRCFPPLGGRSNQLMGVAGIVAEGLADEEIDGEYFFCSGSLLDYIDGEPNAMSATDLEAAGEIDEELLDECADVIQRRWPDLIAEALHYLGQFEKRYADDDDVVAAASSVRVRLEGLASRFQMLDGALNAIRSSHS